MKTKSLLCAAVLCLLLSVPVYAGDSMQPTVEPQVISIGALYNGTTLHVDGSIPADGNVVLRFLGASCNLQLKEKGKVFGLMWMNLDSLVLSGVPSVCIVDAAEIPGSSAKSSGEGKALEPFLLGALKDGARIEGEGAGQHESAFDEFIKLKKEEGLYREVAGNIRFDPASDGRKSFHAEIPVPSRLAPGDYLVEVSAIRNGGVVSRSELPVSVKLVGFPGFLAGLAYKHAALYGVLATLIALLGGLAIGAVFQSKGAH